jgi:SAM-dependent methyltransferase
MRDPYAAIAQADEALQARLAGVLELRAADPRQRAILNDYLSAIPLSGGAVALEIGCGTGAVSRVLAQLAGVKEVVGIDPSPVFIDQARALAKDAGATSFHIGDGRALPFAADAFDLVVFHTTLCHIPDAEKALVEAHRVLCAGGWLSVFDGDYPTATVALDPFDPLQRAIDIMIANFVHNPWLPRRLGGIMGSMGFDVTNVRSHGYTQTNEADYMLTIVDRGADLLAQAGALVRIRSRR